LDNEENTRLKKERKKNENSRLSFLSEENRKGSILYLCPQKNRITKKCRKQSFTSRLVLIALRTFILMVASQCDDLN
jgi:hypothetical protein